MFSGAGEPLPTKSWQLNDRCLIEMKDYKLFHSAQLVSAREFVIQTLFNIRIYVNRVARRAMLLFVSRLKLQLNNLIKICIFDVIVRVLCAASAEKSNKEINSK